jgi:hypothetical protein
MFPFCLTLLRLRSRQELGLPARAVNRTLSFLGVAALALVWRLQREQTAWRPVLLRHRSALCVAGAASVSSGSVFRLADLGSRASERQRSSWRVVRAHVNPHSGSCCRNSCAPLSIAAVVLLVLQNQLYVFGGLTCVSTYSFVDDKENKDSKDSKARLTPSSPSGLSLGAGLSSPGKSGSEKEKYSGAVALRKKLLRKSGQEASNSLYTFNTGAALRAC